LKKKLILLDLLLTAAIALLGWRLQQRWVEARVREQRAIAQKLPSIEAPPPPVIPPVVPTPAAPYADVAQKMLFSKDRNPTIEIPEPPPPKPMPALPLAHGLVLFGETPTVILSEKPGAPHRGYKPGDTIGPFKLLAVNNSEIEFEWEGKIVKRPVQELLEQGARSAPPPQAAQAPQPSAAPKQEAPQSLATPKSGPGADMGGNRACVAGDNSPAGTIADGMRKVMQDSPFGKKCWWEPAK
jgi:hypothetical protein